jgi:hypothetical protein
MLRLLLVSGHLENETAVSLPGSCWTGVWNLLLQGFDFPVQGNEEFCV